MANRPGTLNGSTVLAAFLLGSLGLLPLAACSGASDGNDDDDEGVAGQPSINLDSTSGSGSDGSSGSGGSSGTGSDSSSDSSSGTTSGTSSNTGNEIIGTNGTPGSCEALQIESGCVGELYEGEVIPLDLYVMFDQSGSMATVIDEETGETRMGAVSKAMEEFLLDWRSAGISVGLGHFGHFPLGETSCNEEDYASPLVPIDLLPDHANNVLGALTSLEPTGETSTAAGIRGACAVTGPWKEEHPGTVVANLLVTDGEPKAPITSKEGTCDPTLEDAVAAAAECAEAGVPTYVLGVGPSLDNLNQIAEAGETGFAHLVAQDSSQGVLEALNAIRGDAQLPCEIDIVPPTNGSSLRYEQTDVVYMNSECVVTRITQVENAADCSDAAGGWYFTDEGEQRKLNLCERTCADVRLPDTQFFYSVGCGIDTIY